MIRRPQLVEVSTRTATRRAGLWAFEAADMATGAELEGGMRLRFDSGKRPSPRESTARQGAGPGIRAEKSFLFPANAQFQIMDAHSWLALPSVVYTLKVRSMQKRRSPKSGRL